MDIIECLVRDHERMKAKTARIKSEDAVTHKESAFQELSDLFESQMEAEETAVFERALRDPVLRAHALEGIEMHIMLEMLLSRTRHTEDGDMRAARMKVFCTLLVQNLERKEKEFFSKLADRFESDDKDAMAEDYMHIRERDASFEAKDEVIKCPVTDARI